MAETSTSLNDRICGIGFLQRLARFNSVHDRISGDHPDDGGVGGVFILPPTFDRLRVVNRGFAYSMYARQNTDDTGDTISGNIITDQKSVFIEAVESLEIEHCAPNKHCAPNNHDVVYLENIGEIVK